MSSTHLVYVDDSGDDTYRLYSAIFVDVVAWRSILSEWLSWRRTVEARFGIPVTAEIHSVKFFAGRGRPSTVPDHPVNVDRHLRRSLGVEALTLIQRLNLPIVTVARHGNAVGPAYQGLLGEVERRLTAFGSLGVMIVDGQDNDATYWSRHRELPLSTRRLVEDPWMQPSHSSQLIQIADIVAYSAHQQIRGAEGRRDMTSWYRTFVASHAHVAGASDGIVWV